MEHLLQRLYFRLRIQAAFTYNLLPSIESCAFNLLMFAGPLNTPLWVSTEIKFIQTFISSIAMVGNSEVIFVNKIT